METFLVDNPEKFKDEVKAIIFDFGGVIFNIDYQRPIDEFRELGVIDFDSLYNKTRQTDFFDRFETGKTSSGDFIKHLQDTTKELNLTRDQIVDAWNSILIDIPKPRVDLIKKLRNQYRTFLLSNTNEIHVNRFHEIVDQTVGLDYFNSCFDNIYYSNEIGLRKPHAEVFQKVLTENRLIPGQTLFIDDSIQHVEGAAKVGIHSYHLERGEDILSVFGDWV